METVIKILIASAVMASWIAAIYFCGHAGKQKDKVKDRHRHIIEKMKEGDEE